MQGGSECQAVSLEKGAVGRWDRVPAPHFLGEKVAERVVGTSHHLESAHCKLVEPHWAELQYFSTALALALLIALGFCFFFRNTFFPRHKVLPFDQVGFSVHLLEAPFGCQYPVLSCLTFRISHLIMEWADPCKFVFDQIAKKLL